METLSMRTQRALPGILKTSSEVELMETLRMVHSALQFIDTQNFFGS